MLILHCSVGGMVNNIPCFILTTVWNVRLNCLFVQHDKKAHFRKAVTYRPRLADLSIFYCNFHGHWSQEIKNIIPDPVRRVRTTRSSTYLYSFQVTLPNPRTLSQKSSVIPRTSQLLMSLPPTTFRESYNFSSFKSNINKLYLVPLST